MRLGRSHLKKHLCSYADVGFLVQQGYMGNCAKHRAVEKMHRWGHSCSPSITDIYACAMWLVAPNCWACELLWGCTLLHHPLRIIFTTPQHSPINLQSNFSFFLLSMFLLYLSFSSSLPRDRYKNVHCKTSNILQPG